MTPEQAYSNLLRVAAILVRGDGLPSYFADDYGRKTLSVNVVARMMRKTHEEQRDRGVLIRECVDALRSAEPK